MTVNYRVSMRLISLGVTVIALSACGSAPKGGLRSVSSPGWYTSFKNKAACGKASARVTSDEDTAVTEAIGKARANAQLSLTDEVRTKFTSSRIGGETQVNGDNGIVNAAATKNLFGRMKTVAIKGGKVVNSAFVRQTEGYLQPGDRAFAIVCIDMNAYKETLLSQAAVDKEYRKRLEDAVEQVRSADKELGMENPPKQ